MLDKYELYRVFFLLVPPNRNKWLSPLVPQSFNKTFQFIKIYPLGMRQISQKPAVFHDRLSLYWNK